MYEIPDDDPILEQRTAVHATSAITTGNMGRLSAAVGDLRAFQKRADSLLATLAAMNDRLAALEAEQPPQPRIYRGAAK